MSSVANVIAFTLPPRPADCPTSYRFALVFWHTLRFLPENHCQAYRGITIHVAINHQLILSGFRE